MMIVTHELSVCTDCLHLIANGECGGDTNSTQVAEAQVATWGTDAINMVAGGDDLGFSMATCEGCGSTAGGDRYSASILGEGTVVDLEGMYWHRVLAMVPSADRATVDTLYGQAMAYVWGRQDAGEGTRDTGDSQQFADAYGRHAAAYALGMIGMRSPIQEAFLIWRDGGTISTPRTQVA
jgi:hypothetical protein